MGELIIIAKLARWGRLGRALLAFDNRKRQARNARNIGFYRKVNTNLKPLCLLIFLFKKPEPKPISRWERPFWYSK